MAKRPAEFLFSRFKEFGPVFTLDLMGSTYWVVADMDAQRRFLYRTEGASAEIPIKSFKMLTELPSPNSDRVNHATWRKATMAAVGPHALHTLFPPVLEVIRAHADRWTQQAQQQQGGGGGGGGGGQLQIYRACRKLGLDLSVDVVAGVDLPQSVDRGEFKKQVEVWLDGLFVLPLALPGTKLARAMAAKKWLLATLMPALSDVHGRFSKQWSQVGGDMAAMSELLIQQLDQQEGDDMGASSSSGGGGGGGGGGGPEAAAPAPQGQQQSLFRLPQAVMLGFFGLKATGLRESAIAVLQAVAAAADTTRVTLFTVLALVAMSPRVQEEIFAEQQKVIAEYGSELSYKVVSDMPYLEAVVKEAMRLLPPAAGGMRVLSEPLTVGDVTLPTGALLLSYSFLMHCIDPALWDGDTSVDVPAHMDWRNNFEGAFRPERWLSEETKPKYYYTFGVGKHMCAGIHLVYMEVKTMVALLVRKHRLKLQTPDMFERATWLPFTTPAPGTDTVLFEPR
ncbi:hypothetical protein CHLRE_10g426950v5 [Chlamydomonas reinhardtii]|uniref:Cytochrome P450 n=1 Tax=Chlamydomonas reinhardtii TaxID=3055 RepID=A0A2K3D9L1_CHLRE|nr:uncharacterized protein CHLRE_10g426950v5 [Chlamydomonas reinhardtii]PNW77213.1 hypothetical protein CHLRE_10g426950v5 [Chlamydomonas reinhardtii]